MKRIRLINRKLLQNQLNINQFVPNAPFLHSLKKENLSVFWCFQGLEEECIGKVRVTERAKQITTLSLPIPKAFLNNKKFRCITPLFHENELQQTSTRRLNSLIHFFANCLHTISNSSFLKIYQNYTIFL